MTNAARLSGVGTFYAFEFDDNTNSSFSVSIASTAFSNEFDENTSTTLSGSQRMSATSGGGLIVLDSINEVDTFDNIPTSNLELHLDASSGFTTTTLPTSWQDISGNSRHSKITDSWSPYQDSNNTSNASGGPIGSTGSTSLFVPMVSGVQPGQSMKISGIINASSNVKYRLYNSTNFSASSNNLSPTGEVSSSATLVNGPLTDTEGSREYFIEGTTYSLIIPPQNTFYNAVTVTNNAYVPGSSIGFSGAQILNVPFESSNTRLGVCDGTGSASAYTGVTGTAARTVILGVKFPASPASSYTAFSYGANATGQRFNIRLQSTGQIRILFGSSYVEIPTTAIDDLKDFQLIAVTVPASGTVSDVRVWLNGNEVTSQLTVSGGTTAINTSSANDVTIGGGSHGTVEYLDDSVITKVMIYSTVLNDLEIKQIYQSIIPDIYPFVERAS